MALPAGWRDVRQCLDALLTSQRGRNSLVREGVGRQTELNVLVANGGQVDFDGGRTPSLTTEVGDNSSRVRADAGNGIMRNLLQTPSKAVRPEP